MKSSHVITMEIRNTAKEYALGNLLARMADEKEEIKLFRRERLKDKLMGCDAIPAWIKGQLERDLESLRESRSAGQPRDGENIHYKLLQDAINSEWCTHITYSRQLLKLPDITGKLVALHPTVKRGVVEELRVLSSDLARETGWPQANATVFILTGLHPRKELIRAKVNPTTITLEVDVSVDAETVADKYREIRKRFSLSHTRDAGGKGKKLHLAEFIFSRSNHGLPDKVLFKEWNKAHLQNPAWQYDDPKSFARDRRRLVNKLSNRLQISAETLLQENPYFRHVAAPAEPTVTIADFLKAGMSRATAYRIVKNIPKLKRARWPASDAREAVEKWKNSITRPPKPTSQRSLKSATSPK